jgi:cytochrome c oxidase subunit III
MGTTTVTRPETKPKSGSLPFPGNGQRGNGHRPFGSDGPGPGPGPSEDGFEPEKYKIAVWVVLVGVLMLFVALTSAYLVRRTKGLSDTRYFDWVPLSLPRILWLNTGMILLSSVTLEAARRLLKRGRFLAFNRYITGTAVLGVAFLAGQLVAWRQLASRGIYIKSNPHGSFF